MSIVARGLSGRRVGSLVAAGLTIYVAVTVAQPDTITLAPHGLLTYTDGQQPSDAPPALPEVDGLAFAAAVGTLTYTDGRDGPDIPPAPTVPSPPTITLVT